VDGNRARRGPSSLDQFKREYSQSLRHDEYFNAFKELKNQKKLFACRCTRKQVGDKRYLGTCRGQLIDAGEPHCWRYFSDDCELGDFIVWTKKTKRLINSQV
jgi:glutamyl/glutaminyl-tRNA synthetase